MTQCQHVYVQLRADRDNRSVSIRAPANKVVHLRQRYLARFI